MGIGRWKKEFIDIAGLTVSIRKMKSFPDQFLNEKKIGFKFQVTFDSIHS